MSSLNEITTLCKAGQLQEAYRLAKADLEQQCPWAQRLMGWALYYLIKDDTDKADYKSLLSHLDELKSLEQLSATSDQLLFDKVIFKVALFIHHHLTPEKTDTPSRLSALFSRLRHIQFEPSKGYSFLLMSCIRCQQWYEMADFIEWWNLNKLTEEDYKPFKTETGRRIISLAERAYIAYAKALLRQNDLGRIEEFLPLLDNLMEKHTDMTYPGYFYGKLLIKLGSNPEEALKVIVPFARKKITEFWVWQVLGDVFDDESDKKLACLIRATHCRTQESFLVKVRIRLAQLYIKRSLLNQAKHQIDKATATYLSEGWRMPYELECMIHQPWLNTTKPDDKPPIDFMSITDSIICEGAEEAVAIVTSFDKKSNKTYMICGREKRMAQQLRFKAATGTALKITFIKDADRRVRLLKTERTSLPKDLDYAKAVEGTIQKRQDKEFAFLKADDSKYFIPPSLVSKHKLQGGDKIKALVVYDYNRKKEVWDWICISIIHQPQPH